MGLTNVLGLTAREDDRRRNTRPIDRLANALGTRAGRAWLDKLCAELMPLTPLYDLRDDLLQLGNDIRAQLPDDAARKTGRYTVSGRAEMAVWNVGPSYNRKMEAIRGALAKLQEWETAPPPDLAERLAEIRRDIDATVVEHEYQGTRVA